MNRQQPIFTEKTACQDCYRCIRNCPVKAIKIEQGAASVVDELCIHCGKCVSSCPAGAKKVRDDRGIVYEMIKNKETVIASLAPSYLTEFSGVTPQSLLEAIRKIGFYGVSETALGAEEVSAHVRELLATNGNRTWISSACPVVVKYIQRYHPSIVGLLTPFVSPMQAHGKLLKKKYPDANIVFIGPCIGKKCEADEALSAIDAVLTFEDLNRMFEAHHIDPLRLDGKTSDFIPEKAEAGKLYPVDGGMIAGIRNSCGIADRFAMHFSGMEEVSAVIASVEADNGATPLFLELLACPGGCVNGPLVKHREGSLAKRLAILGSADVNSSGADIRPVIGITAKIAPLTNFSTAVAEVNIEEALRSCGKYSSKDELNCGGCGYGNCREFARAVVAKNAEIGMCVTYMRQLALKKANKLISSMPSGVVIVDHTLHIIECNERFAALAGEESSYIYREVPGMAGAELDKVLPVAHLFRHVLSTGEEIDDREILIRNRILKCTIFSIEPSHSAGGIFSDITAPEMKKDEIVRRAQTVIRNSLSTVQKIAYLLGENASETEMVLSSIIDSYKIERPENNHGRR